MCGIVPDSMLPIKKRSVRGGQPIVVRTTLQEGGCSQSSPITLQASDLLRPLNVPRLQWILNFPNTSKGILASPSRRYNPPSVILAGGLLPRPELDRYFGTGLTTRLFDRYHQSRLLSPQPHELLAIPICQHLSSAHLHPPLVET
jgi:hypothetical protein